MKTEYEIAEENFHSGDYLQAFEAFKKITKSTSSSDEEKADAFNMMGAIVLMDTRVEFDDESGLEYFAKSLEIDPHNIGALLNIIEGFGLSVNNHRNIKMLDLAIKTLQEINYNFSERDKEMINQKKRLANAIGASG